MSDDNAGFLRELTGLTTDWIGATRRRLQQRATPSTQVDNYYAGGGISERGFDSQPDDWSELRDVKEIRESGGVIAQLVHAKALMQFGTGVEFQADEDAVSEYLNDELNDIDNLVIDLGEDAIWYPSSLAELVETNGGSFSHVEPIEPWTMTPRTNEFGDVIAWEQETKADYGTNTEVFEPDEIAHFVLNKSSGRDKTGISEVLRAEQEIERYRENNEAIGKAVELAGFRRHLWRVGREGGMVIDDNELRRVRNLVDDMKSDTQFVMGMDVDHEIMEAQDVSQFKTIAEIDLRNLLIALGLPIEFASVISEGLGSGEQSGVRWQAFMLDTRASQRALADQFIQEVVRPLLRDYSPFPDDVNVELVFGDPVQDREDKRAEIDAIGADMTVNERRALFDREPLDDEEAGEGFESPGEGEDAVDGPFGGLFSDRIEAAVESEVERRLSDEADGGVSLEEFEAHLDAIWNEVIWNEDSSRQLVAFNESDLPDLVTNNLREAILGGAVFSDFEDIPGSRLMDLREELADSLTEGGWTIDSLADEIQGLGVDMTDAEAERVARTETQSIANEAAKRGYEEREAERDEEFVFKWVGPDDSRTTEVCEYVKEQTNPAYGGTPVSLDELSDIIAEANDLFDVGTSPREFSGHISCRHRFTRHVE